VDALHPVSGPDDIFHDGERAVQERAGSRERMAVVGPRAIRDYMPEQHRDFFGQLPFIVVGARDDDGQPWASLLAGRPGFCSSPDPQHLAVRAHPAPGDPLAGCLRTGAALGLLGIEPQTRRRNRLNGVLERVDGQGLELRVEQSFGNCPQYIRPNGARHADAPPAAVAQPVRGTVLDAWSQALVARADMLFIASAHAGSGADVSHRGGAPGFVRVDGARTLMLPDYPGNRFFNTLGNLQVDPRAGLLFIDFATGERLHVAVSADILWDGPALADFPGAERLLRMTVHGTLRVAGGLPLHWSVAEP
jgi:uncharacterized protein